MCIHRIDGCSDRLDEDLVWSWFGNFKIVYYLPWSTRGFDNNAFHYYCYNTCLCSGFQDLALIWIKESRASSCTYLCVSDGPRAGVKAIASGPCSRQTLLRRPLDHAKSPSIEATSLIDLDHWRRLDVRAGRKPGGWRNYITWLAILTKRPFVCLSNNDLIVPESINRHRLER